MPVPRPRPTMMQSFRNASGAVVTLVLLGLVYLGYHGLLIPLVLGALVLALLYQRRKGMRARRAANNTRVPEHGSSR